MRSRAAKPLTSRMLASLFKGGRGSLIVRARAGTSKTSIVPLTPKMLAGLRDLREGETLELGTSRVGRPTRQRLAKYGLAKFDAAGDWDGPMHITSEGLKILERRRS